MAKNQLKEYQGWNIIVLILPYQNNIITNWKELNLMMIQAFFRSEAIIQNSLME